MDLILSSGFLAFARHIGFLSAVEVPPQRTGASFHSLGEFEKQLHETGETTLRRLDSERVSKT